MNRAETFFASKHNLPTELRTAELSQLPLAIRQRAFFMAAVSEGEILQIFRETTHEALSGDLSIQEARRMLREKLDATGYVSPPGKEGGLEDLRSVRRQNVVLETNLSMARNFASEQTQSAASRAFPAKSLVRLQERKEKRNWIKRWKDAFDQLTPEEQQGVSLEPPVAMLGHRIWSLISRFGAPYAPFDFNSGMGTKAVGRTAAKGLKLPVDVPPPAPPTDFNATLQATPAITEPALREHVARRLDGLAEWSGETLIFLGAEARMAKMLQRLNPERTPEEIERAVQKAGTTPDIKDGMLRVVIDGVEWLLKWEGGWV